MVAVVLVAVAALPPVLAVVFRIGHDWVPVQDLAVIDLRTRDVVSLHPPLVGPYSRYGWSHPGPIFFYLLAPLSLLTGGAAWAVLVGAALVQLASVVWIGRLAWVIGRLPLVALIMPVVGFTYAAVGPPMVLEPWNPHLAVVWFILFVLLTWRVATGDAARLVGLVLVGSLLAQTHIGYLPLVAAGWAVAAGAWVLDRRSTHPWAPRRSQGWVALAVLVGLWAPVLFEQARTDPGNLSLLVDAVSTANHGEEVAGWPTGLGLLARQFQLVPPSLGGSDPTDPITGALSGGALVWLAVPAVALSGGWWAATRRGRREDRRWVALMALFTVVGAYTLSRTTGYLVPYLFLWRVPLALMVLASAGWASAGLWRGRCPAPVSGVALALAAAVLVGSVVPLALDVARHPDEVMAFESDADAVLAQLSPHPPSPGPVQLRFVGETLGGLPGILVNEFDRRDLELGVPPSLGFQFGETRVVADPAEIWVTSEQGWHTSELVAEPGARVLAAVTPIGDDAERELADLQRRLSKQLVAAGLGDRRDVLDSDLVGFDLAGVPGLDRAEVDRLAELNAAVNATGRCRCTVVAFRPEELPVWVSTPTFDR